MANAVRGEVALVSGGRRLTLCLTMGALAEIESGLKTSDGGTRLGGALTSDDVTLMLRALLKGGGEIEAARSVERLGIDAPTALRAVAAALLLAGAR